MPKKVLVIGDINVDIIMGGLESPPVLDKEIACGSFDITMGSTAVICACTYVFLGGRVSFLGLAGRDGYGDFMLEGMKEAGIDTSLVRRTNRVKTGVTVNLIYGTTRSQITYPGTIADFSASDFNREALTAFDHVHLAGPYQQTRFRPSITELLREAVQAGMTTSLDPQWDATEHWEGMAEWLPLLHYLFVNQDEAMSISKTTRVEEACAWLKSRTAAPVVKAGAGGAFVFLDGRLVHVPTVSVEVVDTTGAGDVFDAAFLFNRIEKGMDAASAAEFANAAAGRSCLFAGGTAARSTYQDILDFGRSRRGVNWLGKASEDADSPRE